MKKLIQKILYRLSKKILKKYQPRVIGATGSVGKTSTKDAIFWVLKDKLRVRTNIKNYNNELGVPLTIIDAKSGAKNVFKWLAVFWQGLKLIWFKDSAYPEVLILEMAADHPDDIKYLTDLAPCFVGVVTAIGPSHLEFFETLENIIHEKQILVSHLSQDSWAVLNADDNLVYPMHKNTSAKVLTYGMSGQAKVRAENIEYEPDGSGLMCKIKNGDEETFASFKNILSLTQLGSFLAAVSVAKVFDISLTDSVDALRNFKFPVGRLQIIPGIKQTTLIDDTYNSSPMAVKVALEVLSRIETTGKRWAILGDMLELGGHTETAHREVGEWIKQFKVDRLVVVGEKSTDTLQIAEENGLADECAVSFDSSDEACKFIQNEIKPGDLILIKGSQSMRMEKITKEIMAEPLRAKELLVRQSDEWLNK